MVSSCLLHPDPCDGSRIYRLRPEVKPLVKSFLRPLKKLFACGSTAWRKNEKKTGAKIQDPREVLNSSVSRSF